MTEELQEYLRFARETAYQAGRLTLEYFNKGVQADTKADGSPVTIADRKAEELIRRVVEQRYPDHAVLGEEFGESGEGEQEGWVRTPPNMRLTGGMFARQIVGRSMEPLIPDGAICAFRAPVTGSRQGRLSVVFKRRREIRL